MTRRNLEEMSKEELIRELQKQDRALREAQQRLLEELSVRYSDPHDFSPLAYCTLDPEGRIKDLNLAAAALLGVHRDALVGSSFASVATLKNRHLFYAHMEKCLRQSERVTSELTLRDEKRGTRTVQIISDPRRDQGGATTAYRTILVDLSDLRAMENRLRLLSEAGERLGSFFEYTAAIEAVARIVVPALSDLCMIDVASEAGTLERKVVLFADPKKQATLAERLMQFTARPGWQSPQARVIASGDPMLLSEMPAEPGEPRSDENRRADPMRVADIRSLMVVPLKARGRTFGALTMASAESDRRYSPLDLQVAQDLSSRIAMALDNARLYDEAQRANQALRLAEAQSSGIVSISADAIISIDEDYRMTLFNEGAEKVFGYSKAEAVGAPLDMLIPQRFRAIHRQHVARFAAGEQTSRRVNDRGAELFGLRKNGEEFPIDAAISKLVVGSKRILTVALRDVTEQKRIESDQRFLAEVGAALVATLDYGEMLTTVAQMAVRAFADFCFVDIVDQDGQLQRVRVVGRDPSKQWVCDLLTDVRIARDREHLGWQAIEWKHPIRVQKVTAELLVSMAQSDEHLRALRAMEARAIIAVPLVARGELVGALKFVSTNPGGYGEADLLLAEGFAYRAALAIDGARLYRTARKAIQARDAVLGIVAHDLRNPLGTIGLQAQLLRVEEREPGRRSKPAEAILRAVARMKRLTEDLLDVTRIEEGQLSIERKRVRAGQVVVDILESEKPLASGASLDLRIEVPPKLPDLWADRDRLMQVFENLIGNALKFTARGGCITIGAKPREGEVLFWVADTGEGVPADEVEHLFERFWQARKADRQGAGLGLAIVKGIVEKHGGKIWVESKIGVGTTFLFTVPTASSEGEHAPRDTEEAPPGEKARPVRILIVDDEPRALSALQSLLMEEGFFVETAQSGSEAVSKLAGFVPDVLVADVEMSGLNGVELTARVRKQLPEIPVILMTGHDETHELVEVALQDARVDYIGKPIDIEEFVHAIRRALVEPSHHARPAGERDS